MSKIPRAPSALRSGASYEYLKKQARELQRAVRAGDEAAIARVCAHHPKLTTEVAARARADALPLADAQLVLAREYGFISWPKLKTAVLALAARADEAVQLEALSLELRDRLVRFARLSGLLSTQALRRALEGDDFDALIDVASGCFAPDERALLLAVDARLERMRALSAGLSRLLDGMTPEPVGEAETQPEPGEDAEACLVVLYAHGFAHLYGKRCPIVRDVTRIGRNREQEISLNSDAISRAHCTIERSGADYVLVDQHATNHTFVLVDDVPTPITRHVLRHGDRIAVGDTIMAFLRGRDLDALYRDLIDRVAERDGLTDLLNRSAFLDRLAREVLYARGCDRPLSLLQVDIDDLRGFNAALGNLAGNGLLRELARALQHCGDEAALVGRLEADRFGLCLPGVDLATALERAEALRRTIEAFEPRQPPPSRGRAPSDRPMRKVTISCGVSTLYRTTGEAELLADAEHALGAAKRAGRNQVRGPDDVAA